MKKKVKGPNKIKVGLRFGWICGLFTLTVCVFRCSGVPGGGEVSGGGTLYMKWGRTIVIVTSAVYGEREYFNKI
jgi:hypothetical protein